MTMQDLPPSIWTHLWRWTASVPLLLLILVGCSALPLAQQPDTIHKSPHSGGSVLAFDPTSQVLASAGWEGRVWIWKLADHQPSHGWQAHDGNVNGVGFRAGSYAVVTAGLDGVLAEWSYGGKPLRQIDTGSPITHMVLDEANQRVVTGHSNGLVRTWGLNDFQLQHEQRLHHSNVKAVAVQPGSNLIASSGSDGRVMVWEPGAPPREMEGSHTAAWTLDFSPDGQWLMGAGWFRLFRWRLSDGVFTSIPTRHHGIIKTIQYSEAGDYVASISRQTDSAVYFLDPDTGEVMQAFGRHELCGGYVAVSPDGRHMASTADDASLQFWNLREPEVMPGQ